MFTAEEAVRLDVIDRVVPEERLLDESLKRAAELGAKRAATFRSLKKLLRQPVAQEMVKREEDSLREFVEIWYSDETRELTRNITFRN